MIVAYRPIDWIDWLPKGKYRVGDNGSVQKRLKSGEWKTMGGHVAGCRKVTLCHRYRVREFTVASLVLRAFVGPRPIGCSAFRFPDRNPENDSLSNLKWAPRGSSRIGVASPTSNSEEFKRGRKAEHESRRQFSDDDVAKIFECRREGWPLREIAGEFGADRWSIIDVLSGRNYKDVPCDRSLPGDLSIRHGDKHPNAKLTALDIPEIREQYRSGVGYAEIAQGYGVTLQAIRSVITGRTWAHVDGGCGKNELRSHSREVTISEEDILAIQETWRVRTTFRSLAQKYGVSLGTIGNIVHRRGRFRDPSPEACSTGDAR